MNIKRQVFILILTLSLFAGTVGAQCIVNAGGAMADICQGGTSAPLNGSFGGDATGAIWSSNVIGSSFTNNLGDNPGITTWTPPGTFTGAATLTLTPFGGSCIGEFLTKDIIVVAGPSISVNPLTPDAVCIGGTLPGLNVIASNGTPLLTYQWYSNTTNSTSGGTIISGAMTNSYTPPTTISGTLYYYCVVSASGSGCGDATSTTAMVTVDPVSAGGSVSGGTNICSGSTSGLLTLSGQTGTVIRWQSSVSPFSSWTDITNTATTYTSGALTQTTQFRAVVQNGSCTPANSTSTTVTVDPASAGGTVSGGTSICSGSTSGLLTLSEQTGAVIRWQRSISPFISWTNITNTATTYTSGVLTQTTQFRAVVQSGSCPSANSTATTVTLDPASAGGSVSGGSTICSGNTSALLTLAGQTGTVTKWQSSISPFSTWTDIINTATTYTSGSLTQTTQFRAVVQNGGCTPANSTPTTVTVDSASSGGTVSGGTNICSGGTSGLLTLSGQTGAVIRWQSSISPFSTWTDITNTATTYTSGALTQTTQFRAVVQSGSCTSVNSNATTVTVDPASAGGTVSGGTNICSGSTSGLLTLSGQTGTVIRWQRSISPFSSWTNITNTATTYTSGALTQTTQFRAVVQSGSCVTANSTATTVTVDPASAGGSVSGGTSVCSGSTSGLLTLSGQTGAVIRWQSSISPFSTWSDITNTATTYTSGALTQTTQFRAVVQSGSCAIANSTTTTVTVDPASAGGTVSGGTNICSGSTSGLLTLTGQTGAVIRWQSSISPFSVWTNISNTATTYTSGSLTQTTQFRAVVQSGSCAAANSATTTVTITPNVGASGTPTPSASTICQGSANTSYTTSATNATSYNWSVTGTGNTISGNGPTGTVAWAAGFSGIATVSVTATGCGTSAAASTTVTVRPAPTATISGTTTICQAATAPNITFTNPNPLPVTITYNINGANQNTIGVGPGTSATVAASTTAAGVFVYNLVSVVYQTAPACLNIITGTATVTVNPLPTPTLISSDPDNILCTGTSVTFTAGGGTSYIFRLGGVSVQSGTSATYTTSSLTNGQVISVTVTNANGCSATSTGLTNIVNQLPFIIVSTPPVCAPNLLTYSLGVTVGSGTVTSTSGTVTNTGGNIWTIAGVLSGTNITVKVTDLNSCESIFSVTAPNCSCPPVTAPVSGGDKSYCALGIVPSISATVLAGETVDWYNSSSGGTRLLANSLNYTPSAAGTYYAMARNTTTNCVSSTRTAVKVTMDALPLATLTSSDLDNIFCAGTSVTFTAEGGTSFNFMVGALSVQNGASASYTTSSLINGQVVSVIVTNAIGCSATSTGITNTVNPLPTANAGTGGNECDLNFTFSAVAGVGTGTWTLTTGPGTATFSPNSNTPTATVTVSEYGTYTFSWTEVSGTCSRSSTITVNFYQQPVANAGTGGNNCGLEFYLIGSLNSGTGTWSKVSGPGNVTFSPNANNANALVTVTAYGSYTFRWTVTNSTCSNSATIAVTFIQQPPANAGTGGNECDKDFIMNATATIGTGTWTKISGPGNSVFSPDNHQTNATVTVDQVGTYDFAWTVINSTCTSSDIVRVVFHDLPLINAGIDTAICKGGSIQLYAQGIGTFVWVPAASVSNPDISNPITSPDTTTTFIVTLTDQFGCKKSDDVKVEVRVIPVANAGPDQVLEYVLETTMDAVLAHNYETGIWSLISGTGEIFDTTYAKTSVSGLSLDKNQFLWKVSNRVCLPSFDTVSIIVQNFIIPTLITPNLDGKNDYFVLKGLTTLGKTELLIFDRRGAQVYKSLDYDNNWDGVDYNNNPLPDDTYFYVLKTKNGISISGYIVIRR